MSTSETRNRGALLRTTLSAALALWLLASAALWLAQERLLFHGPPPPAGRPAARGVAVTPLRLDSHDGLPLVGWMARPEGVAGRLPTLIYFGGNAEEVSHMVRRVPRLGGRALVAVNYRGYGGNPGEPGERAIVADALAIHDAIRARPDVDPQRVAVMGRSLGSGVAVQVAAARELEALVLVTPYDSIASVAAANYPWAPVRTLLRHPFDSLAHAAKVTEPTLVVIAGLDRVVPPAHGRRLAKALRAPLQVLERPGRTHHDIFGDAAVWRAIATLLR